MSHEPTNQSTESANQFTEPINQSMDFSQNETETNIINNNEHERHVIVNVAINNDNDCCCRLGPCQIYCIGIISILTFTFITSVSLGYIMF